MSSRSLGYTIAYAVLVIGAFAAVIFSERPLSSTVVTLALFSFNLAAILFMLPQLLNLVATLKAPSSDYASLANELKKISARLDKIAPLATPTVTTDTTKVVPATPAKKISLSSALISTASDTDNTEEIFRKPTAKATARPAAIPQKFSQPSPVAQPVAQPHPVSAASKPEYTNTPWPMPAPVAATVPTAVEPVKIAAPIASSNPAPSQLGLFVETSKTVISNASPIAEPSNNFSANNSDNSNASDSLIDATDEVEQFQEAPIKLFATINVGEESVLCLRGEGGGLNWQEGVPLNYLGENRWSYETTSASPVSCQLYLNDEIAAFGDDIILTPGQTLEIAPNFPAVEA